MKRSPTPLAPHDWPEALADLHDGFAGRLNVYRVMAHHPALLRAWAGLRAHVVEQSALGRERSEVVILRTGARLGADYEIAHHVCRARALGIGEARIAAVLGGKEGLESGDAVLVAAVDALVDTARLPATLRDELIRVIGIEAVFDLMATVGFYATLGFIVKSFDVPVDASAAEALALQPAPALAGKSLPSVPQTE